MKEFDPQIVFVLRRGSPDSAVVAVHQHGIGDESGAATGFRYFQVWTFRDDTAIRLEHFGEREQALAAMGLASFSS